MIRRPLILPDGSIDEEDRRIIAGVYPILSNTSEIPPSIDVSIYLKTDAAEALQSVTIRRRKTDRSSTLDITVNRSTVIYVNGVLR